MTRILNDNFDIVAKKYLKLKSVSLEYGVFKDQNNNFVVIIKKEGDSKEGFGIDLLKDNEGSLIWAKEILLKASIVNPLNFRLIIIYHKTNFSGDNKWEPNYIWSEYKNGDWKYIGTHEYREKEKTKSTEALMRDILDNYRKNEDPNYPSKEYLENFFKNKFEYFLDIYNRKKDYIYCFYFNMGHVADECLEYSLLSNFLKKDSKKIIDSFYTSSKLRYLSELPLPFSFSGTDVSHIKDVFIAVAINECKLLRAYFNNKPGPFSKGLTESNIFANSLYLIIDNNKTPEKIKNTVGEIDRVLDLKSVGKYEKAFLNCLKCVITHDYDNFLENINIILKLHRSIDNRYTFPPILKYTICLPAIAFYNLAYFDKDRKTPMPPEPEHPLWNSELWNEIINGNQKREYIIDIEKVSPVLKKWMDELPEKIDFNELVESLK